MSKKDTSYADAMNEWAAKQSFLRNKRNRILHPDPGHRPFVRFLGYALRLLIVLFLLWAIGTTFAKKYYSGEAFNTELQAEIKQFLDADEFEALAVTWSGKRGACKKITASGSEAAAYRSLEANQIAFELPLLQRLRKDWTIDELRIDQMSIELKSGGKMTVGQSARADDIPLIAAGLLPTPDLDLLKINRVSCQLANLNWGLSRSTSGAITGTNLELYSDTPDWQIEFSGGELRQNWLHGLVIKRLQVNRQDGRLKFSRAQVGLGKAPKTGTIEGEVTLGRLPELDLMIKLPSASTRDLFPPDQSIPELFHGECELDLALAGSINTLAGVETRGTARFNQATFNKVPAFEAIDKMLGITDLRLFTPEEGEVTFATGDGKLKVSQFEFRATDPDVILRGEFTYTPAITSRQAASANADRLGGSGLAARKDEIVGKLRLGIRPALAEGNELARRYFKESAEGRLWMEIPLFGPLAEATTKLKAEILSAALGN